MRIETHDGVPNWVWIGLATTLMGGFFGAALFAARRPSWDRLLRKTGAPRELATLAAIQRYTESRGNPKAGLGRPELFPKWAEPRNAPRDTQVAESNNAAAGYDRNKDAYMESPYPRIMWIFGTGGAYGMLPSSALAPWRDTDELRRGKVTPYDVFNPWRSTVFFVDYVHRLVKRFFDDLPEREQTIMALKRGMASPDLVLDYRFEKARSRRSRENSLKAIDALGLDESILDTRVPAHWPDYPGARELVP